MLIILSFFWYVSEGGIIWLPLLFLSVIVNYFCVSLGMKRKFKYLNYIAVVYDVCLLVFFKYINGMASAWLRNPGISVGMPIGISYFTFMLISFVIDSADAEEGMPSFNAVLLYVSFFAAISSGPITQYADMSQQLKERSFKKQDMYDGLTRFGIGMIKKMMFAEMLAYLVDKCFRVGSLTVCMAWLGALAFSLQLYYDFSGYSDMAIGIGKMFGISLAENFDHPYASVSITDFWRKWHISLTRWFTKYVYIPLGGNRVSVRRHIFNLFVVWLLTGLWHGPGITFIIWGMIHFGFQILEKYTRINRQPLICRRIYTLLVVVLAWSVFRAESLSKMFSYLKSMFGLNGLGFCDMTFWNTLNLFKFPLLLGCCFALPVFPGFLRNGLFSVKRVQFILAVIFILCFIASYCMGVGFDYAAALYAGF